MVSFGASAPSRAITILVVEDNPGDVRMLQAALLADSTVRVWVTADGVSALRLLEGAGEKPDLIMLDLNLPRMDGRTLLGTLKSHPEMCAIPVIVLTQSNDPKDVQSAYRSHANCYIRKPIDFVQWQIVMHRLIEFWVETVRLPEDN